MDPKTLRDLETIAKRLRIHSVKATSKAGSGHPTTCLSAADLLAALFFHTMRYEPDKPHDPAADRFILSKGHAAPLLWAVWAEAGVIKEEELLTLREMGSDLEGHPTPRFPWVDVATGSLGQGLSVGVGMAWANRLDESDARVFVLLGDGECAEGAVWEAASLAGHYRFGNLVALLDANKWGQSQEAMYGHDLEVFQKKFESSGWEARLIDGHDMPSIVAALDYAMAEREKPLAIIAQTHKGKGVSFLEDKPGWHGKALNAEELAKALRELGEAPPVKKQFRNPPAATKKYGPAGEPEGPRYTVGEKVATRAAFGEALVKLGKVNAEVVALDGDTKNSTFSEKFMKVFPDRFLECFIAEQNMVGTALGLAARGKIPFASTFGAFLTRAYDQIRMAGISRKGVKLCGSHAGISIGEDGPSQMALEDLAMMRAIPGMTVLYPADAVAAEKLVFEAARLPGLVFLRTQRPATPVLYSNEENFPVGGLKVLRASKGDKALLVAAGVTLIEGLKAWEILQKENCPVRVVDLYSVKPVAEKELLRHARETGRVVTVEDHYPEGGLGDAVLSALGPHGIPVHKLAVNRIPRSGKPAELMAYCGISAEKIVEKIRSMTTGE